MPATVQDLSMTNGIHLSMQCMVSLELKVNTMELYKSIYLFT